MKIAFASDHIGRDLKMKIIEHLTEKGFECHDFGPYSSDVSVDYPDWAAPACKAIQNKEYDRAILVCGTGIGMAITANKFKGVYAAVCHDLYSTQRSILSNDCNTMCIGALVVGPSTALAMVDTWVDLTFKTSPSLAKVNKIKAIEAEQ